MHGGAFFEQVVDAMAGFLPPDRRRFDHHRTGHNVKVWFGDERREHYEAQVVSPRTLRASKLPATGPALEIGFHAEHPDAERNARALDRLLARATDWRATLGAEPTGGAFVGDRSGWTRLSEFWLDSWAMEPEAAVEAGERLAAYITALEPIRTAT